MVSSDFGSLSMLLQITLNKQILGCIKQLSLKLVIQSLWKSLIKQSFKTIKTSL